MASMLSILSNLSFRKRVLPILLGIGAALDLILLLCPIGQAGGSVLSSASLWVSGGSYLPLLCLGILLSRAVTVVLAVSGTASVLRKGSAPIASMAVPMIGDVIVLLLSVLLGANSVGLILVLALRVVLSVLGTLLLLTMRMADRAGQSERKSGEGKIRARLMGLALASMLPALVLYVVPVASYTYQDAPVHIIPLSVLSAGGNTWGCAALFALLSIFVPLLAYRLFCCAESYRASLAQLAHRVRGTVLSSAVITGGYWIIGVAAGAYKNARGAHYEVESYYPFLLSILIVLLYALLARGLDLSLPEQPGKAAQRARVECFVYGALINLFTLIAALGDLLRVEVIVGEAQRDPLVINGYRLLFGGGGYVGTELLAFLLLAVLTIMLTLFLSSVVTLISRSRLFFRLTLAEIVAGSVFTLAIALFGKYYEIVQRMNEEMILSWIESLVDESMYQYSYAVHSSSFLWFVGVVGVLIVFLLRKPYTLGTIGESVISFDTHSVEGGREENREEMPSSEQNAPAPLGREEQSPADPCPIFSELDRHAAALQERALTDASRAFPSPTLPEVVRYLVEYAAESEQHLSYTPEEMAAFLAGLGASRLTILQGMSGTGKTSLPKIVAEALMGRCEMVEVESSWRDKNELLGYFNEFTHTYNPKKFTRALYRAALDPDRLTLVVLDEMNLSRIEYYFSDFLSLMEHAPKERRLRLVGPSLYRTRGGKRIGYRALIGGHTLPISPNVYFVGTANRDESTFEISDKVYDRAHTMNFNRRAPRARNDGAPMSPRYLSYSALNALLENAKAKVPFTVEECSLIGEVEQLLAPYHISFGNRVANQIEDYVRIYCACFPISEQVLNDAVESILLTKVVMKLERKSVENRERLAGCFDRLGLYRCGDFVRRLHED